MILTLAASTATSFCYVFLKGFQHKNVNGDHKRSVFFTSFLMAGMDYAVISFVVHAGWPIIFSSGFGAAFGMVAAMTFHDKIFKTGETK